LSSILRALKKLENEPRHQEESPPLENKFLPSADTGTQSKASSMFIMVVAGGIVCGLVILAGWWLFSEKFQTPPAVPYSKISLPDSRLNESPASSQSSNEEPIQAVEEKKSIDAPEIQKITEQLRETEPAILEMPVKQIIPQEDVFPAEEQIPAETVQAQETPNLKINEQAIQPAEKPLVVSAGPRVIPAKTLEVEVPRLNDPDMKLQAVTWSREPQKRIAVINNRILREGDLVSGYLIKTINQDDVVLSRDGEKWELAFH